MVKGVDGLELTALHVFVVMSAPLVAAFAVRAGANADFDTPSQALNRTHTRVFLVVCAIAATAASVLAFDPLSAVQNLIFVCGLGFLALVDLRMMVVPVRACILLAIVLAVWPLLTGDEVLAGSRVVQALLAHGAFRLLEYAYRNLRKTEGLGAGDALVAAILAARLGIQGLGFAVALGAATTLAVVMAVGRRHQPFPLAPGLAFGGVVVLVWTQSVAGVDA
jgi:prepilin signal peptidase PulO-like enzyme (type II secretory pathway)